MCKMAELEVKGGNTTATAIARDAAKSQTVTLTFSKPDEVVVYNELLKAAEDKDYSLSKYIVRVLTGKESFGASE
jgi:hypothetical protein